LVIIGKKPCFIITFLPKIYHRKEKICLLIFCDNGRAGDVDPGLSESDPNNLTGKYAPRSPPLRQRRTLFAAKRQHRLQLSGNSPKTAICLSPTRALPLHRHVPLPVTAMAVFCLFLSKSKIIQNILQKPLDNTEFV
jgi:hypothetical protein